MGQRGPAQRKRPVEVDREVLVPVVIGHRLGSTHLMPPSDVDQDVKTAQLPDALLDSILTGLGGRDVDDSIGPVFDVGEHLGQPCGVPADAENRCALP
jgi:hypothetical protein